MADEKQDNAPVAPAKHEYRLVVVHPFGDYRRGDEITDFATANAVLTGENKHHVHKTFPR
jgi:hypothetical protein